MSRIGKHSISIPQGVNVTVDANNIVTVTGPKGTLSRDVHKEIKIVVENKNDNTPYYIQTSHQWY